MKDSETYARKIKKLLGAAPPADAAAPSVDLIERMVHAVFEENATAKLADKAVADMATEFVDLNELRVSPIKDICECVGRKYPGVREKALAVTRALKRVFDNVNVLSLEYLVKKPKREVRRRLREDLGLSPYAEAVMTLTGFQGHAIPVDELLLDALKLEELIYPDSDVPDLQGFLERIISSKTALAAHAALRAYAAKAMPVVQREWARRQRLREEAEAKARAEAEAKARAEAEAKARAEAEVQAGKDAAARKKAEAAQRKKAKASAKKTAAKKAARKSARKRK